METLTTTSGLTEYEAYIAQIVDDQPTSANTEKFAILNGIKWFAVDGVLPMKHYFEQLVRANFRFGRMCCCPCAGE